MGYQTNFKGTLTFTTELTARQLAKVKSFLGEDWREHPEWTADNPSERLNYIDLQLTDDFSGLEWSGAEKTDGMVGSVNLIIRSMREEWSEFGLKGRLHAQGEDVEDRWELYIGQDGLAHRRDVPVIGQKIKCPHCDETFILEEAQPSA